MAYKSSPRGTRPVSLLAVHTAEGARTARSLAAYFSRPDIAASSHDAIDSRETLHMVAYHRASWTLRSGNPISDNVELCGFARWTRAQWLSTGVVDGCGNPRAMLYRLAAWITVRARARNIPTRKLTVAQVARNQWGVIAHNDWTLAKNDGTHWDPGPGFPWDYVMTLVNNEEDDMPTPKDLLNAKVTRSGSVLGGTTSLGALIAWYDAGLEKAARRDAAILAAVSALSRDPGIDEAKLSKIVDAAVDAHTPSAADVAAAQLPHIEAAVHAALDDDNKDLAADIVRRIADNLATTPTPEET